MSGILEHWYSGFRKPSQFESFQILLIIIYI